MVSIDGDEPIYTPHRPRLAAGDHTVRLLADRYHQGQELTVRVCGNMPPAEPKIVPRYKASRVLFAGFPPGASVLLNGETVGTIADTGSVRLTENQAYSIAVWMDGETLMQRSVKRGLDGGDLLPGDDVTLTYRP